MAKYSVPGIRFTEIDNTVRSNSLPGLGIGAIVFKSNKGPVNQRILTSSYDYFTQLYGEPENLDDYGHFAAENYLAISNQLLCVRATMGDEGYAQIQYPYTDADAKDTYYSTDTEQFKYIDNEDNSNLKLLGSLNDVTTISSLTSDECGNEWQSPNSSLSAYFVRQKAQYATVYDLISDNASAVAVFKQKGKEDQKSPSAIELAKGIYVEFATNVSRNGDVTKWYDDLIFNESGYNTGSIEIKNIIKSSTGISCNWVDTATSSTMSASGVKLSFTIPGTDTLNGSALNISAYYDADKVSTWYSQGDPITYNTLFDNSNLYHGSATETQLVVTANASKIQFRDWDDCVNKTYYVNTTAFEKSCGRAVGIQYREYGMNTNQEALAAIIGEHNISDDIVVKSMDKLAATTDGFKKINDLADQYGCDAADISTNKYSLLTYYNVWDGPTSDDIDSIEKIEKIIYTSEWNDFVQLNDNQPCNEWLFWTVSEKDSNKATTISVYTAETPSNVVIPWQEGIKKNEVGAEPINVLAAYPTSEIMNSTNDTYRDGYTMSIESDDEPGNGDIEQYTSNKANQLIIASIGPGEYGNDIGVSIITTECANIPALNHQNAFNWKYRFDDETQVDNDIDGLTWKKVFRINVYVKTKTQTANSVWGTGMDALLKDPVETFYVSTDPQAKDANGNSLFAPNVINGYSEYIYVSRNSTNDAKTGAGTYAQPHQTYAIYQLTGGTNSTKNNMSEKTAALKLYKDRQKADFDVLFNVEAIDSFNGKQRYAAHQNKIAEIAGNRKIDIGVVQVTSREGKSIKRQLGEAKMFSFNNGSYVAEYAGYDKYYNSTLASWIYLPKSVAGACAMAYCDMYDYPWMAPAGVARGTISYTTGQLVRLTDDEIGQLYDCNVNTSRESGGFGEVLWGHKTALKKESALNRINVRRCLNYIEKNIEQMMVPYLFQQNTSNTRSAAKNSIDAFLSRVQAGDGIIEYKLSVTEDTEDPHIMNVNIKVKPAEAIEFIDVKITVDRNTGVTSTEE